jgi:hypothetical protein
MSLRGDQNKGTGKLIEAMTILRQDMGIPVGLLMVEWGTDTLEVKEFCVQTGLVDHIKFLNPMSRVRMQKTMAACDALTDQFHYEAFGALSIRAWEQGIPVVSRRISTDAISLVGEAPPVHDASNAETIASALLNLFHERERVGRDEFVRTHQSRSRSWLLRRHHHDITRQLQIDRYTQLLSKECPQADPGAWGAIGDWVG